MAPAAHRTRFILELDPDSEPLSLHALLDRCPVRILATAELPAPESLINLNEPAD